MRTNRCIHVYVCMFGVRHFFFKSFILIRLGRQIARRCSATATEAPVQNHILSLVDCLLQAVCRRWAERPAIWAAACWHLPAFLSACLQQQERERYVLENKYLYICAPMHLVRRVFILVESTKMSLTLPFTICTQFFMNNKIYEIIQVLTLKFHPF